MTKPRHAPKAKPQAKNQNNPYMRPFGRLTVEELEKEIHKTEQALADCQARFADADQFRAPARAKELQDEYEAVTKKLEDLEQEYFAREL